MPGKPLPINAMSWRECNWDNVVSNVVANAERGQQPSIKTESVVVNKYFHRLSPEKNRGW